MLSNFKQYQASIKILNYYTKQLMCLLLQERFQTMGTSISIDKHVSSLDDILEMSPAYFDKIKFESKISPDITQHLKIWKFAEDRRKFENVKSSPVPLSNLQSSGFYFSSEEAYLLLIIYKSGQDGMHLILLMTLQQANATSLHSLTVSGEWFNLPRIQFNLTPRGLQNTFSSNDQEDFLAKHQLDSFLLSKRRGDDEEQKHENGSSGQQFKYMIFVWNGKQAGAMVKAQAISKGYELDGLLSKAKDSVLQVFFSGGVVRNKKLQRSNVLMFDEISEFSKQELNSELSDNPNTPSAEQIYKAYQTVYLFKWLFPENVIQKHLQKSQRTQRSAASTTNLKKQPFEKFAKSYGQTKTKQCSPAQYWNNFEDIDSYIFEVDQVLQQQQPSERKQIDAKPHEKDDEPMAAVEQQKPQIPAMKMPPLGMGKLNLSAIPPKQQDEEMKQEQPQIEVPKKQGFSLDFSKAQKFDENRQDSQMQASAPQEPKMKMGLPPLKMSDPQLQHSETQAQAPKKMGLGLGLDLTKAKTIQQESLEKNAQIIQKAKDNAGIQIQNEGGASLSINIANLAKIKEVQEQEYFIQPVPLMRRGAPEIPTKDLGIPIIGTSSANLTNAQGEESQRSTNSQGLLPPEKLTDEDFDMKGTSRKEYENEYYKRICSEIIEDFLYLGSDFIAKDSEILKQTGITHVINCAADYSANYFEGPIKYKKYHLKDHVREQIECVFYDAIEFIEDARKQGGKVYVHCVQGVSRSATICLAYLIYSRKITFNDGLSYIYQEKRPVANPNMTFIAQLICFYKRLFEDSFDSVPISPRVFMLGSHQPEDPELIVSILVMENLYQGKSSKVLDPRSMFIVQSKDIIKIWVGAQIPQANLAPYREYAERYVKTLQHYERAPQEVSFVNQFEEDSHFWRLFNLEAPPTKAYDNVMDWNLWFIDLGKARQQVRKAPVVVQMQSYQDEVKMEQHYKPRLFTYPDAQKSNTIFDEDDLQQAEALLVLCVRAQEERDKQ